MKKIIAVVVLAVVASVCEAQQQKVVKPTLSAMSTSPGCVNYAKGEGHLPNVPPCKQVVKSALPDLNTNIVLYAAPTSPCGRVYAYDGYLILPGTDGVCRLSYNLHFGPEGADCRIVASAGGKTLNVTCAWKPTKKNTK